MPRPTVYDVHVNRPLSQISVAYRNANYIAEEIFPIVPVEKKSDLYFVYPKQAWFRNRTGPRAPGTKFPRADYPITTASYVCVNDALAKEIPDEVRANSDAPLRPDITATNFVTDGLLLGLEKRVADIITGSSNWAAASTAGTLWSNDSSDPWGNIDTCVNAVVSSLGTEPNVAVMSWDVWRHLRQHPDFLDRVKYTRPGGRVEPEDLRSWFGFEKVLIGRSLIDSAQEGASASMSYVWGNDFWCGYVTPTAALETPTAGYVFRWGNRTIERFRYAEEKMDLVAGEWFTAEKITASDAGAIMANCV
jgi:hypothetical protein